MSISFVNSHSSTQSHKDAIWASRWTVKNQVISASADGQVIQWDATSGQVIRSLPPHTLGIVSLSVPPIGELALYNTLEGLTALWDLESGEVLGKYQSYTKKAESLESAWQVSLHPNTKTYAATGGSGNVTIHTARDPASEKPFGTPLATLNPGRAKFGMSLVHSPDGTRIALATESGQIYLFDIASASLITTYYSHAMTVRTLSWSPDSSLLFSGSDDRRLTMHDVRLPTTASSANSSKPSGGAVAYLTGHSSWVLSSDVSPDSKYVVSGSADKTLRIFDISSRSAVSVIQETGEVWSASWKPISPIGGQGAGSFISGGEDGVVKWWRSAGSV